MTLVTYNNLGSEPGKLGPRETRYLLGFAQGFSYKEVARDCGVSPNTVAGARKRILYKLNAINMKAAITQAFIQGLIHHLVLILFVLITLAPVFDNTELYRPAPRPYRPGQLQTQIRVREEC